MGVKTKLSLKELNNLFPSYDFTSLLATTSGIIDTTYIAISGANAYILKKYERDISQKIQRDIALLDAMQKFSLNTPRCLESSNGWYLYEKLIGSQPKCIKSYHIQALARFLAKFHTFSKHRYTSSKVIEPSEINAHLKFVKANFYAYYKKLLPLRTYMPKRDGIIHGDIFKDNTVFEGEAIGVFDFIDAACGEFAFDAGVALVGFDAKKHKELFVNLFLHTYNQSAPKKLTKLELLDSMQKASQFYALKRITNFKKTKTAKEILK